ncbi:MAG: helix-turn-helix domain-containing protein [Bacillota bacterium]
MPEAAAILGISRNRAYEWCRKGIIPHARDRRRIFVPRKSLDALAERIASGELLLESCFPTMLPRVSRQPSHHGRTMARC